MRSGLTISLGSPVRSRRAPLRRRGRCGSPPGAGHIEARSGGDRPRRLACRLLDDGDLVVGDPPGTTDLRLRDAGGALQRLALGDPAGWSLVGISGDGSLTWYATRARDLAADVDATVDVYAVARRYASARLGWLPGAAPAVDWRRSSWCLGAADALDPS